MLLLNGATGIAVGMATNCPPHNLGELVDGMQLLLADRNVAESELYRAIPAPDFPTGGIVMGTAGARDMFSFEDYPQGLSCSAAPHVVTCQASRRQASRREDCEGWGDGVACAGHSWNSLASCG